AQGQHPQLADGQLALRGPAGLGGRDPLGHEHRPGAGPATWALDEGAEPGPGVRGVEPVRPQELLDAVQLAYLVDLADDADAPGPVPRPGVRPAVQGRGQ